MSTKYTLGDSDVDPKHYAAMLEVVEKVAEQHAEALDRAIAEFYLASCKTYPDLALSDLVLIENSSKPLEVKIAVHPDAVLRHMLKENP